MWLLFVNQQLNEIVLLQFRSSLSLISVRLSAAEPVHLNHVFDMSTTIFLTKPVHFMLLKFFKAWTVNTVQLNGEKRIPVC